MTHLNWLPQQLDWREVLRHSLETDIKRRTDELIRLARRRLDFIATNAVDRALRDIPQDLILTKAPGRPVRLAILGSCTTAHLHAAIRVAALRREIPVAIYECGFGQYWQELEDVGSGLHKFDPNTILVALDAYHLTAGVNARMSQAETQTALSEVTTRVTTCWHMAQTHFACHIIHQLPLPIFPMLLGSNEHRLPGSRYTFLHLLSARLCALADAVGVDILSLNASLTRDGLAAWHDKGLWHRAKQEISPPATPMYGDLLARILAAHQGRSSKCLVMDLDNTLWGGVIGDDGLKGLVLGQGSALGEAFAAFQTYARELSRRGVILAVCSKNDEANALEPFERHPDMVLGRDDVACFVANWSDKATNIRTISERLNIGLDSLVFVDDNPFERELIRQELPMVAVPEIGDDPTTFPDIISDAGYFEGLSVTSEDRERATQYRENQLREGLRESVTDLSSYLRDLRMQLLWRHFDDVGLARIVQLINKTNQFNLTTKRYSEQEVLEIMNDPRALSLQLRLTDRFGDNGMISVIIGKMIGDSELLIDTWLMSCRVLGRQVEAATLNLIARLAANLGAKRLIGEYVPSAKNAMVRNHYLSLGFQGAEKLQDNGGTRAVLDLDTFEPHETFIAVIEG